MHHLERLAEDDPVVGEVAELGEALVQVALDDGQPALDAADDVVGLDLDAAGVDLLLALEALEQLARAAAEVQHAGAPLDQLDDEVVVAAARRVLIRRFGCHCVSPPGNPG